MPHWIDEGDWAREVHYITDRVEVRQADKHRGMSYAALWRADFRRHGGGKVSLYVLATNMTTALSAANAEAGEKLPDYEFAGIRHLSGRVLASDTLRVSGE